MHASFAALLALATPLLAIQITSPTKNSVVDPSKGITIQWSTVNTDPSSAHLLLVNQVGGHTPFTKDLGEVDLSAGHITVSVADVPADSGYQFNFVSVEEQNTGILAQSPQFRVKASSDSSSASSSSGGVKTSAATLSVTQSSHTGHATGTATGDVTTLTGTATTLSTSSATGTGTATGASKPSGTAGASSSSTGGAALPTGMVGGVVALVAGVAAVLA
ncbi:Ser-Thr-rich glycosyl-phosphatidyl-inositol-anchored membrane family-domain-containing protein [Chaetomium sp. MPI-SDFR-AT-0129]|nr:Ser-Thr-rich glycosyl-phosphatidyl-inositol-anchored membrane family-domain-containing protein [Chaetomium sp. MPI-SDFR-AT-0129]